MGWDLPDVVAMLGQGVAHSLFCRPPTLQNVGFTHCPPGQSAGQPGRGTSTGNGGDTSPTLAPPGKHSRVQLLSPGTAPPVAHRSTYSKQVPPLGRQLPVPWCGSSPQGLFPQRRSRECVARTGASHASGSNAAAHRTGTSHGFSPPGRLPARQVLFQSPGTVRCKALRVCFARYKRLAFFSF